MAKTDYYLVPGILITELTILPVNALYINIYLTLTLSNWSPKRVCDSKGVNPAKVRRAKRAIDKHNTSWPRWPTSPVAPGGRGRDGGGGGPSGGSRSVDLRMMMGGPDLG